MTGEERRCAIVQQLRKDQTPASGSKLASLCGVSRQVIVQDIALLRTSGYDVISTSRGYIMPQPKKISRMFKVKHTDEQMEEELTSIVAMGGCVADVMIHHRVYGTLRAELGINSQLKVQAFLQDIKSGKSSPLKNITSDYHYHTVEAESEEILDAIEDMLREKHFLVKSMGPVNN